MKVAIQKEVEYLWVDLSVLYEVARGVHIKTNRARKKKLKQKYKAKDFTNLSAMTEIVKQRLQMKVRQLRMNNTRLKFYRQSKIFKRDGKKFYTIIGKG